MNYSLLIFDVGGTLIHFNHVRVAQYYAAAAAKRGVLLPAKRIDAMLTQLERELPNLSKQRALSLEKEFGKSFWDDFYAEGFRRLGIVDDMSQAVAQIRERFMRGEFEIPFEDARPALEELSAREVPMGIVSNFSPNLEDVLREQDLHRYFQFFIVSAIAGVEKPDPKIFDLAVITADHPREKIAYVGDSVYHDMDGAHAAGIAGILVDRAGLYRDYAGARIASLSELLSFVQKEKHAVRI